MYQVQSVTDSEGRPSNTGLPPIKTRVRSKLAPNYDNLPFRSFQNEFHQILQSFLQFKETVLLGYLNFWTNVNKS